MLANFVFENTIVKMNGTTIAIPIATKYINILDDCIDKIAGNPPTPTEFSNHRGYEWV